MNESAALDSVKKTLFALCWRYRSLPYEAEDLWQEANIAAIKAIRTFKEGGGASLRTWVDRVVRNHFNHLSPMRNFKRDGRPLGKFPEQKPLRLDEEIGEGPGTLHELFGTPPAQETALLEQEERALARAYAKRLKPKHRRVIEAVLDGATLADIAREDGTVRQYTSQLYVAAVKQMKRMHREAA